MSEQEDLQNYALRLVSQREYSVSEWQKKLRTRFPDLETEIVEISADFLAKKFLSDERFAQMFVEDKVNLKDWGRTKISQGLFAKGIADFIAKPALAEYYPLVIEQAKCLKLVQKKSADFSRKSDGMGALEKRKKITAFLSSRGFSFALIGRLIDELGLP